MAFSSTSKDIAALSQSVCASNCEVSPGFSPVAALATALSVKRGGLAGDLRGEFDRLLRDALEAAHVRLEHVTGELAGGRIMDELEVGILIAEVNGRSPWGGSWWWPPWLCEWEELAGLQPVKVTTATEARIASKVFMMVWQMATTRAFIAQPLPAANSAR